MNPNNPMNNGNNDPSNYNIHGRIMNPGQQYNSNNNTNVPINPGGIPSQQQSGYPSSLPPTGSSSPSNMYDDYRSLCSFDVHIQRGPDGRLGLSLHSNRTFNTNRTLVKVNGFSTYIDKHNNNKRVPYPAEESGLIQCGDILVAINRQNIVGRTVKDVVPLLALPPGITNPN